MKTDRVFALIFGFLAIVSNMLDGYENAMIFALMGILYAIMAVTE